jgi:dTDP-4-dehydrorhamnose reductase
MIKKKVLVTGSNGMLGSTFVSMMGKSFSISVLPSGLDIADTLNIKKILNKIKPDIIFHAAAYTDVDGCELDPDKAYRTNVLGTENLISFCRDFGAKLIYISSTGVYGDKSNFHYTEDHETHPTTVHHSTKLNSEVLIQNNISDYLILRVGWLYGGGIEHKNNFVYKRFLEAKDKNVIYSDDSQKGNPTSCTDVVNQIFILMQHNSCGIFNCVNSANNVSRYVYVKEIINLFGLNCNVEISPFNMFKRSALVSKNESAVNEKLDMLGINIMPAWQISLSKYIQELKEQL